MPTLGDSGEGRTCTRRNSALAILEVSGGQNQFPGGQADLINCPLYSGPGRRLSETRDVLVGMPPFPKPNGQKGREPGEGGTKGEKADSHPPPTLPDPHLCLGAPDACSRANFLTLVKVWGAF